MISINIKPNLVFNQSINNEECLQDFADGLWNLPADYDITSFSVKLQSLDKSEFKLVNYCLRVIMKRRITDLELDINFKEEDGYQLPSEIFICKTVDKLTLGSGFAINNLPTNASLPSLKTLILGSIRFNGGNNGCALTRLLSVCPVIEELSVYGFNGDQQVQFKRSPKLNTLTLKGTMHYNSEDVESVCDCLLDYCFVSSSPVEILKITNFEGDMRERVQMKNVLEKSPSLKLLEVHATERRDEEKVEIMLEMLTFPRASSNCQILVMFA